MKGNNDLNVIMSSTENSVMLVRGKLASLYSASLAFALEDQNVTWLISLVY